MPESSSPGGASNPIDRFLNVISALNPVLLLVVGYFLNTSLEHTRAEVSATKQKLEENSAQLANLKLAAETSSIALQQRVDKVKVISDFLKELTSDDDRRRSLAIEAIFIALPDEATRLVKVVERFGNASGAVDQKDAATAKDALAGVRTKLVADMFSDVRATRIESLSTLQRGWSDDPLILDQLVTRATSDAQARQAYPEASDDVARQQIASVYNTVKFLGTARVPADLALRGKIKAFLALAQHSSADAKREALDLVSRFN
jgi:hypothetical protein